VAWYVKGLPETQTLRQEVNRALTPMEVDRALDRYLEAQPDHHLVANPALFGTLVDPKWQRYR
jgi:hypothetical protein